MTIVSVIKVKAMVIAPNDDFTAHAVSLLPPTAENPGGYHRLIGGSVEFGETHREAVEREVREELGADLIDAVLLGTVENIFEINGETGHEIVFVYNGRLDPQPPADGAQLTEADGAVYPVVWRSFDDASEQLPLFPDVVSLVHRLPRPGVDRGEQKQSTVAAYESDVAGYSGGTRQLPEHVRRVAELFARDLGPDARVLEIGSASGRDAAFLESLGGRVDRTDITPGFVDALRAAGHDARVVDPLTDDLGHGYDGVWANAVLLHLNRPEMAVVLHRLRSAVRPGGRLYCSVKEGDGDGWSRHGNVVGARHFTFWREPHLREVLSAAGWKVESIETRPGSKLDETWLFVVATR